MRLCDPFSYFLLISLLLPQLSAINFQGSLQPRSVHLEGLLKMDLLSTFGAFLLVADGLRLSYISHIDFNRLTVCLVFLKAAFVTTGPSFLNLLSNTLIRNISSTPNMSAAA